MSMKWLRALRYAVLPLSFVFTSGHADEGESRIPYRISDSYDPERDAFADLEKAKEMARKEDRRILLVVGGKWCPWCRAIEAFLDKSDPVSKLLADHYVVMPVNVSDETSNTAFLNPFPAIEAYPHLFILDEKGDLIHSQDTGKLEKQSHGYDEESFVELLQTYRKDR